MRHNCFGDVRRDRVFKTQNISELFVKLSGRCCCFITNVEQLNRDSYSISGTPDTSIQNKGNSKLSTCPKWIGVSAVAQDTACGSHGKISHGTQSRNQSISETRSQEVWRNLVLV